MMRITLRMPAWNQVTGSPRSPTTRSRNALLPSVCPENSASLIQKYPNMTTKLPNSSIRVAMTSELVAAAANAAKKNTTIRKPVTMRRSRICAMPRVPSPATW